MTVASTIALVCFGVAVAAVWVVRFRVLQTCGACNGWLVPAVIVSESCADCGGTGEARERVAVQAPRVARERAPEEAAEAYF